jgi:hypothetical protein
MLSRTDIVILFIVVISALSVAIYQAWIDPLQALVALVILVVAVAGLSIFTKV